MNLEETVIDVIAQSLECEHDEVLLSASLVDDLGADSLDLVDISFTLGKRLSIKMPNKPTLTVANELVENDSLFVSGGKLTELGSELLVAGPNQYAKSEVTTGTLVMNLLSNTLVSHWCSLCHNIMNHSAKDGDQLLMEFVDEFCTSKEIETISIAS